MITCISVRSGCARWALAGGLAALLSVGHSGCSGASWSGEVDLTANEAAVAGPASAHLATAPFHRKLVAPVFAHGKGECQRGLLCDEDAIALIRRELLKVGIALTDEKVVVYHGSPREPTGAEQRREKGGEGASPWIMDAVDPDRRIAVEYVSAADGEYLHVERGWRDLPGCVHDLEPTSRQEATHSYELLRAARWVCKQLDREDVDPYVYAVFYDPGVDGKEENVLAQVRDFIDWMRLNHVL